MFKELNAELQMAQKDLEAKLFEYSKAKDKLYEAEQSFSAAKALHERLKIEVSVYKTRLETIRECAWNERKSLELSR